MSHALLGLYFCVRLRLIVPQLPPEQQEDSTGVDEPTLHALDGQRYAKTSSTIPLWGDLVIFNTRLEALDSLQPENDSSSLQYVRLVLLADYPLLSRMCEVGKESVRSSDAGLYLKVCATCPAYYAMWDTTPENTTHEVLNILERAAARDVLLKKFKNEATGGNPSPLSLNVTCVIDANANGVEVKVDPGVSVGQTNRMCDGEHQASKLDGNRGKHHPDYISVFCVYSTSPKWSMAHSLKTM
ncbi:unnamed protein product [Pylaiella littoralis]